MSTIPPYPRKNKHGCYATGPGIFWWNVWKTEYSDIGGILGYASWIEANKQLNKKRRNKK
jgi:hypothetical protein